ncbi:hypothetical protein Hdeb2414_s0001g00002201 [Helianthus debilis subsp. tardiflorus]
MTELLMCNRVDTKITMPSMEDHDECFFLLGIEDLEDTKRNKPMNIMFSSTTLGFEENRSNGCVNTTRSGPTFNEFPAELPATGQTAGLLHKRFVRVTRPGASSDPRPNRSDRPIQSGSENIACD